MMGMVDESGVWKDSCFFSSLGRRAGGMFCMPEICVLLKGLFRCVDFTKAGRCGDQADVETAPHCCLQIQPYPSATCACDSTMLVVSQ